jgi:hypothetical protein
MNYRSIIAAFGAGSLLAGCSPQTQAVSAGAVPAAPSVRDRSQTKATLYALNLSGSAASVSVYSDVGQKLLRTIQLGSVFGNHESLVYMTAAAGLLYTESPGQPQQSRTAGLLRILSDKGSKKVASIKVPENYHLLAADNSGNVFTMCGVLPLCEYSSAGKLVRKFSLAQYKVKPVEAMAANASGDIAIIGGGVAAVFAPGATKPFWTIGPSGDFPGTTAATFDASGSLYIADLNNGIFVFQSGSTAPSRRISDGISAPADLATDPNSNLYVLNRRGPSVTAYAPGRNDPSYTINSGLSYPVALAIDPAQNLYVDNSGIPTGVQGVAIYSTGGGTLERTVTQGIQNPVRVAVDP